MDTMMKGLRWQSVLGAFGAAVVFGAVAAQEQSPDSEDMLAELSARIPDACPAQWESLEATVDPESVTDLWAGNAADRAAFKSYMTGVLEGTPLDDGDLDLIADDIGTVATECAAQKSLYLESVLFNVASNVVGYVGDGNDAFRELVPTEVATFTFTGADQHFTVPTGVSRIIVHAWGAGGRNGDSEAVSSYSSPGGYTRATVSVTSGQTYTVVVGEGRRDTKSGEPGYGGGGHMPPGTTCKIGGPSPGATGGGLSGLFSGAELMTFDAAGQARSIVIAGGGGTSPGGASPGGGLVGGFYENGSNTSYGGSQSAGGKASPGCCNGRKTNPDGSWIATLVKSQPTDGGPLRGGTGSSHTFSGDWNGSAGGGTYSCLGGRGGGGAGYFGGGGTGHSGSGGGSSYVIPDAEDVLIHQGLYVDTERYVAPASEPEAHGLVVIEY